MSDIQIVVAGREHIDDIVIVENLSFRIPWSRQSILEEVLENKMAIYFCAVVGGGYTGGPDQEGEKAGGADTDRGNADTGSTGTGGEAAAGCPTGSESRTTGKAVGYAGMWQVLDEGHITNIAVHPEFRNYGIGSALMEALLAAAGKLGMIALTLEVRRSNHAAQELYRKYGFAEGGLRKAYYADNKEDALIMWKKLDQE